MDDTRTVEQRVRSKGFVPTACRLMFHFHKPHKHCTNCGQQGHSFRDCQCPVTSFGILLFRIHDPIWKQENVLTLMQTSITGFEGVADKIQVLLIQRRDTLGFVDILRGKYQLHDTDYIKRQIAVMTTFEKERLLHCDFDQLWKDMWGSEHADIQYKKDKEISRVKLQQLRETFLPQIIAECTSHWDTPEWGFPKGRREPYESDLACALREVQEETGLTDKDIHIIHNLEPLSESFFGTNHVHYCHKYYVGFMSDGSQVQYNENNPHMKREIGNLGWFSLNDALQKIRPDNVEKREVLLRLATLLRNYCPCMHPPS